MGARFNPLIFSGLDLTGTGGGGSTAWGSITGTLSNQTDLQSALDAKAPTASPTFSGTITTALTASRVVTTNGSNQLVASSVTTTTLAFLDATSSIQTQLDAKAPLASPTFTGSITFGNYKLQPSEFDAGNSGTSKTLDWTNGSAQKLTLTGNVTLTLSNPQTGGAYVLRLLTGAGSFTVTWPGTVKWAGGSAPTITTTASRADIVNLYFDGTNYYGSYLQNYTP